MLTQSARHRRFVHDLVEVRDAIDEIIAVPRAFSLQRFDRAQREFAVARSRVPEEDFGWMLCEHPTPKRRTA